MSQISVTKTSVSIKGKFFLSDNHNNLDGYKVTKFLGSVLVGTPYSIDKVIFEIKNEERVVMKFKILRKGWEEHREEKLYDEDGNKIIHEYDSPFGFIEVSTRSNERNVTFNIELYSARRGVASEDRFDSYSPEFKEYVAQLKVRILSGFEREKRSLIESTKDALDRGADSTSVPYAYDTSVFGRIVHYFLGTKEVPPPKKHKK
jgi:hypothetical protein